MAAVPIIYFSDVLCVWAYVAQLRVDEVKTSFADQVQFDLRFCSVFGDTARKIPSQWGAADGYERFNAHLRQSMEAFPEITLNSSIWRTVRPLSSTSPHLFLKAAQLADQQAEALTMALRTAFFRDARDIAQWDVQCDIARQLGVDIDRIQCLTRDGSAFASLAADYHSADQMDVQGSPSFVLNNGRQKLYGNVGYKIIEANIQELLRQPQPDQASWC